VGIVSFGYPPIPHVSGVRAASMGAALAALGHEVTAVTVDWRAGGERPRVVSEDGVRVVRVDPRSWHPAFDPRRPPFVTEPPDPNALRRRLTTASRTLAWGPHPRWARHALARLRALHGERPLDVVWAIHGDDSSHEIAHRFRRAAGVPWVADFKDAWNFFHPRPLWPIQWVVTWNRLRSAALVTETSEAQAAIDAHFGRPWRAIWSGYDDGAMAEAPPRRTAEGFTLAYFGNVSDQHEVHRVPGALAAWRRRRPAASGALHVFGHEIGRWERAFDDHGLADWLRPHDVIARPEAFGRMKGADVLVLLPAANFGRSRIAIGVKELEYVASGTPVLVLGRLLPELDRAIGGLPQVVQAANEEAAASFLEEEHAAFVAGARSPRRSEANAPAVARFAWSSQARLLAEVLAGAARTGRT
jgi:glycosyltransferase involved in cell wall biosynthesis